MVNRAIFESDDPRPADRPPILSRSELSGIALIMLDSPGMVDAIRRDHVDDATGHCKACPSVISGRDRWPCNLRLAAGRANQVAELETDVETGRRPEAHEPAGVWPSSR